MPLVAIQPLDRADEAVAAAMQRFHEPWMLGVVAQHRPQALDRRVQPMLEVDERAVGPQPVPELLAGQHFSRPLEQHRQQLERLVLQAEAHAVFPQLTRAEIELESPEPERAVGVLFDGHLTV